MKQQLNIYKERADCLLKMNRELQSELDKSVDILNTYHNMILFCISL